jgi:hypothetical protein
MSQGVTVSGVAAGVLYVALPPGRRRDGTGPAGHRLAPERPAAQRGCDGRGASP